jgi:hypothetical protein
MQKNYPGSLPRYRGEVEGRSLDGAMQKGKDGPIGSPDRGLFPDVSAQ